MFALVAALMSSSCIPVPGADQLWTPVTRWVIVGEMHGTNETPDAFANLVCLAAATGRPVTVAVEYPANDQAIIDGFLNSDGGAKARSILLTLTPFRPEMQDGRGSVAIFRLLDRLRLMKQAGQIKGVVASDADSTRPLEQTRDAAMAQTWKAIASPEKGIILALVGNVHAMRLPMTFADQTLVTAGSLMPPDRTITVHIAGNGGQAWNCRAGGCTVHGNGPSRAAKAGINYSTDKGRQWDASYELGLVTTAAFPASSK